MKRFRTLIAILLFSSLTTAAIAECVQVGPEICLPLNKYKVPINELPLYGLVQKTPEQKAADEKFIETVVKDQTREQVVNRALDVGWDALNKKDYVIAARRFNQAFLLDKADSRIYHAFAILVTLRWKDHEYAEQLFKLAKRFPNKYPALNADYGRLLLLMSRPKEALPLLEQAVKDTPKTQEVWANLAFARLDTGDQQGACAAIAEGLKLDGEPIKRDAAIIKSKAECK
jgi:predicted Zn-dependent protease